MYTCAGANSVPVCVSPQDREASKSNAVCWPFIAPCCGFIPSDAPSPLRTPEDSQTYEHISRSILPVSARPVSVCQLPTFSDVNPVQARKGGRQMEKTHNTEGLGSENISMFFSNSIANKKGFLPRPARFRGWRPGAGREAGSWQGDAIRNLVGIIDDVHMGQIPSCQGVFSWMARGEIQGTSLEGLWHYGQVTLNAAASVPTAAENRPVNVAVPTILYLGIPA